MGGGGGEGVSIKYQEGVSIKYQEGVSIGSLRSDTWRQAIGALVEVQMGGGGEMVVHCSLAVTLTVTTAHDTG